MGRSGDVDFAEFVHYVTEHEKKLALVFNSVDTNRDGEQMNARGKNIARGLRVKLPLGCAWPIDGIDSMLIAHGISNRHYPPGRD